ncbi:hypothetical protein [Halocola ammonii]
MKKLLFIFALATFLFPSCSKAPGAQATAGGAIAADLKSVIDNQDIDGVIICCVDCECNVSYDEEGEYEFQGANFIVIDSISYNLNNLHSYDVQTIEDPDGEEGSKKFLILFFP